MKRALLGTLWIGAVAAGTAIALQMSGLLARPVALLGRTIGLVPNDHVAFGNYLVVIALGFAVAWTILQVTNAFQRAGILVLLIAELIGAAWLLQFVGASFLPLPSIVAVVVAAAPVRCGHGHAFRTPAPARRRGFLSDVWPNPRMIALPEGEGWIYRNQSRAKPVSCSARSPMKPT